MPPPSAPLTPADLPAPFQAADRASGVAQRRYLTLFRANLLTLIVGALLTAVPVEGTPGVVLRVLSAATLASGLFVTGTLNQRGFRDRWYRGRAVAESVKTRAWRYSMRAEPFDGADEQAMDALLLADFRALTAGDAPAASPDPEHAYITDRMRRTRALPLDGRKAVYLRDRIQDQRRWYTARAEENEKMGHRFFAGAMALQVLAFAAVAVELAAPDALPVSFVGVLSTMAAALLTWTQLRRHDELQASYAAAANDLGMIEAEAPHFTTEAAFSKFVADAESAVSREHTFWLARRDTPRP